jgi:dihydroorotase
MGLPGVPAIAEKIMLERDLALVELTGAPFLVDQITTAAALESLARGKAKGLPVTATTSINHLSFNEVDIGDYRTFLKFDPPVRSEDNRQATIEALASGLIDIVVSAHAPAPAEDKRLPFDEAAPGAVGLQTLLPALLSFQDRIPLIDLMRTVTSRPAELLGLPAGRLAKGAPADLVLCDLNAPMVVDLDKLRSKSRNSPFDGRRLFGEVRMTLVDGRVVYQA